ncbi:protein FAM171B [Oryzias melastigma]|uniref:Protein FAM171B-like n=2 Tax=Oryzias melastigma TaxID=30732 RepID=A0A3B3DUY9_ORYME|nr:protein FAM171B [Oryzias melastigma]
MYVLWTCLVLVVGPCGSGHAAGRLPASADPSQHADDGNLSRGGHVGEEPLHHREEAGSSFNLRVQVNDLLSQQHLSQAVVEVFLNYTRNSTALSGEDGRALLHVPFHLGLPSTVLVSKTGYIPSLLSCKTSSVPLFSSVTMSLLGLNQGNMWLFEDYAVITGKAADSSSQPNIRFPKSLLNVPGIMNFTSVKAYLTVPQLKSELESFPSTVGVMDSKSRYVSVELRPLAAVSVQLFSGDTELQINGPVQISLPLPDGFGQHTSKSVPAWFLNRTTGAWMKKGLGQIVLMEGKPVWTFTAPHLGYWVAASTSSSRGFFRLSVFIDFISQHTFFLMVLLGGMLLATVCLLLGLLHLCRREVGGEKALKLTVVRKKDQSTSTSWDEASPGHVYPHQQQDQNDASFIPVNDSSVIRNPAAVAVTVDCDDVERDANLRDRTVFLSEQVQTAASLVESLFFYNQPVAILPAPGFLHVEERTQRNKSATLPRAGTGAAEVRSKDGLATSLPKNPTEEAEDQPGASEDPNPRSPFPESASVPGTLSKIGQSRKSGDTAAGFSKNPSPQLPRAWFVSLEGKPAAEIHHATAEQQRRRRPAESRDTSLDSGVDMSELNAAPVRRAGTLERRATFVKRSSQQ